MIANETTTHKKTKMTQTVTTIDHCTAFNNYYQDVLDDVAWEWVKINSVPPFIFTYLK